MRLHTITTVATNEEIEVNQVITLARSPAVNSRRNPIGGTGGSTFLTAQAGQDVFRDSQGQAGTPPRQHQSVMHSESLVSDPLSSPSGSRGSDDPTRHMTFLLTALSNAEQALRTASNSNAPLRCWGCQGLYDDDKHLFGECPRSKLEAVQANFKKNLDIFRANRRERGQQRRSFDPNNYKRDGFVSKRAVSLLNQVNDAEDPDARKEAVNLFLASNIAANSLQSTDMATSPRRTRHSASEFAVFATWMIPDQSEDGAGNDGLSFNAIPADTLTDIPIRFPISIELPHIKIPVGKHTRDGLWLEGLFDTGGACNMGDLAYWKVVAERFPDIQANFHVLEEHSIRPISIGGIGAGRVEITHLMEIWLPWVIGGNQAKCVIGLGDNMPLTLLLGLPFIQASKCNVDVDNLMVHSRVFNADWKLTMKIPHKKTIRALDVAESSPGRTVLFANKNSVSPTPTKKATKKARFSEDLKQLE